jgi:hypothetical protein
MSAWGIAILHHGSEPRPPEIEEIDLQIERHRFRLPVSVIWDGTMPEERSGPVRRWGVQFKELGPRQLNKLEQFIWSLTSGWLELPSRWVEFKACRHPAYSAAWSSAISRSSSPLNRSAFFCSRIVFRL